MPQAPDRFQPANPNVAPAGMGFAEQPHPFWKALEGVVNGLRMPGQMSKAPWGMHEPTVMAGAGVDQGMQGAGRAMADPRNAWIGMGPVAGMAMMGRGIRGAGNAVREMGGFNPAIGDVRKALDIPRPNIRRGEIPGGDEKDVRTDHMSTVKAATDIAHVLMDMNHPRFEKMAEAYQSMPGQMKEFVNKTMSGIEDLRGHVAEMQGGKAGGQQVPSWFKFGQ